MSSNLKFLNCFASGEAEDIDEEEAYRRLDNDQVAATKPLIDDDDDDSGNGEDWNYFMAPDLGRFQKTSARSNPQNRRQLSDTFVEADRTGTQLQTKLKRSQMKLKLNYCLLYTWKVLKKGFLLTMPGFASMFMFAAPTSSLFTDSGSRYNEDLDPAHRTQWI